MQDVLELIGEGLSFTQIIEDYYPDLQTEDIRACVQYAIEIVASEDIHIAVAARNYFWIKTFIQSFGNISIIRGCGVQTYMSDPVQISAGAAICTPLHHRL